MERYLFVAEKPSMAKSIAGILSQGGFNTTNAARLPWIKNYTFSYQFRQGGPHAQVTVTSVAGHLFSTDFSKEYRQWKSCDPEQLFDAPVEVYIDKEENAGHISNNLTKQARDATHLMIWTDCDREGEHIGSEVMQVCLKANPRLKVLRASFNAIIPAQIHRAAKNPVQLDERKANAVAARIELDLRVGAILTRYTTMQLQARLAELDGKVLSYGPCQFPTLGFVVDQYNRVAAFVPEKFWYIALTHDKDGMQVRFSWKRGHLFDEQIVETLHMLCAQAGLARVIRYDTRPTQKYKPRPLNTVELQKTGSRLLRISPSQVLAAAEALYLKGLVSYPRTETDQFANGFDFMGFIGHQTEDARWGTQAQALLNGGFNHPRNGKKNDNAHEPIHPVAAGTALQGDEARVYELITRRFLASCASDAKGLLTSVDVNLADELFHASGLTVTERNYLDIYVYDKWEGNLLPTYAVGETFAPSTCEVRQGQTSAPSLLTEADLVSLMDKNGIGTDATIAEHISKVIEREYVWKQRDYLVPSTLGMGLVTGFNAIDLDSSLSKPHLRRRTERRLVEVCEGAKSKNDLLNETLYEYRDMFVRTRREFEQVAQAVERYLRGEFGDGDDQQPAGGANGGGPGPGGGGGDDDDGGGDNDGGASPPARRGRGRPRGSKTAKAGTTRAESKKKTTTAARGKKRNKDEGEDDHVAEQPPPPAIVVDEFDEWDDAISDAPLPDPHGKLAASASQKPNPPPVAASSSTPRVWDGTIPNCGCGKQALSVTVTRDTPNKGKVYFVCPTKPSACKFFQCSDPDTVTGGSQPTSSQQSTSVGEPCKCGTASVQKTVSKEGVNKGRKFWVCAKPMGDPDRCDTFVWDDEMAAKTKKQPAAKKTKTAAAAAASKETVASSSDVCFKCGKTGHWASACPSGGSKGTSYGGGSKSGYTCFSCGKAGHWANACPSKSSYGRKGYGRW